MSDQPPLIDAASLEAGQVYTISLPAVDAASSCQCAAAGKLAAFAYRIAPAASGAILPVKVAPPWQLRTADYVLSDMSTFGNGCKANIAGEYCEVVAGTHEEIVWFSTEEPVDVPAEITLRLGSAQ